MEKNFRSQESFVSYIDVEELFGYRVHSLVLFHPLLGVGVVLCELLGDVGTDVTVSLFDRLGRFEGLFRRYSYFSFSEK